jgi:hypothetical protein
MRTPLWKLEISGGKRGVPEFFSRPLKVLGRMADGVDNPMRVDTSLLQGIAAAGHPATKASSSSLKSTGTTTSFTSALKSASEKETTKAVDGQQYSEILTGPRAGMYLNTGGGARDGQAFILVKHDGREDHIYGTGSDRKVISSGGEKSSPSDKSDSTKTSTDTTTKPTDTTATTDKAPSNEKTKGVPGRAYADILNGPRSGLYLNTSGNVRDGHTFALVKREGREFHIYGTGKDREIIGLHKPDDTAAKSSDTSTSSDTATKGTTTTTGPLVTNNATDS